VFDVVVRAHPDARSSPTTLGRLLMDSPTGQKVPLAAAASVGVVPAPNLINRESASRRILVTCNAEGRDVAGVARDIQQRLESIRAELPTGYHLEIGGEYEARSLAARRLLLLTAAALAGIFVLLYVDFRSIGLALLILLSVPLAGVGGVVAVLLTGGDVSLGSMVGFVTVFGIAVRNGILLISHYGHLREAEGHTAGRELVLHGAAERLSPILMTASSAALGLLPLVLRGNLPGHEIEYPMAIVIIGGLVSSTFLTLGLLPVLYECFAWRWEREVCAAEDANLGCSQDTHCRP
jgi:Cu/Ag efflux pump CusA